MQMNVNDMRECVKDFVELYENKCYRSPEATPCEVAVLGAKLIEEEHREYMKAGLRTAEELDGLVDLIYVTLWTGICIGVPVDNYLSHQTVLPVKTPIDVTACVQDLYSRFPCAKIQHYGQNFILRQCLDTAARNGYDLSGAFYAVQERNMDKLWTNEKEAKATGHTVTKKGEKWLVKNAYGKVVKPVNFAAADLSRFIL